MPFHLFPRIIAIPEIIGYFQYLKLTSFIKNLWGQGNVTMPGQIIPFEEDDLKEAVMALNEHYKEDILNMPGSPPDFDPAAALWGAQYIYRALQCILLRDIEPEVILEQLKTFSELKTAEAIYSADLSLRYLPQLFNFAKGLSPEDILTKCLHETANEWPFSSVGIELTEVASYEKILEHTSLRLAYIDRIIAIKDYRRAVHGEIYKHIGQALGSYSEMFWPEFKLLLNT